MIGSTPGPPSIPVLGANVRLLAQPEIQRQRTLLVDLVLLGCCEVGGGKECLTGNQHVEPIANVTLVTEEVDAALLFRHEGLFNSIDFGSKCDTASKDNVGVCHVVIGGNFLSVHVIRIIIVSHVEICPRTHLANVSCEGTLRILPQGMSFLKVKVVRKDTFWLIALRVELNRGAYE